MRSYIRETIDGFIFWSFFQGLAPMIWFFPLNELEISGYEAFAGFWFMPVLCGIPGILPILQTKWMTVFLKLVTVACIASFQSSTTVNRLIILAFGAGVSMVIFTSSLSHPSIQIRQSYFRSLMFGFFTLLSSRIWFTTFIPPWWSDMSNSVVMAMGVGSTLDALFEMNPEDMHEESKKPETENRPFCLFIGFGMGSLLFASYWCFGEVSVITRWVVKGYPYPGPDGIPWGAAVILALYLGVVIADFPLVTNSFIWLFVGGISFVFLYALPTWKGFGCGLFLAVFLFSIWPKAINLYCKCPPARTAFITMATFIIEVLFSVWTTAYNFVPGGAYTRERSDILIGVILIGILFFYVCDKKSYDILEILGKNTRTYKSWLLIIVMVGCAGIGYRQHKISQRTAVKQKGLNQFTSAIWTYHFGYDNRGWPSLEQSLKLLNETGADVITLLESDASKTFLGNNDLGAWLGEHLGMYVDFGPSTRDHTWGNLILSRYPFVKSTHHLLPSPHGELAPAITATINISGSEIDFVVTHMGNDRDKLDRELQTKFLVNELNLLKNPVVFMGYITTKHGSREYNHFIKQGNMKDIDAKDKKRFCEYIFYRDLIRIGYARISHGGLSDTELQMAKFEIPKDKNNFTDNRRTTINPGIVKKSVLFSSSFGGHYPYHRYSPVHGFHMDTPKYFVQ